MTDQFNGPIKPFLIPIGSNQSRTITGFDSNNQLTVASLNAAVKELEKGTVEQQAAYLQSVLCPEPVNRSSEK